jgi:suppressor for copper-sensitivity B
MFYKILNSAVLILAFAMPARAQDWQSADYMQARLIASVKTIGAHVTSFDGGLETRMDEGWHSYWRTPGDSGLPPRFNWDASENIASVSVHYPAPERFDEYGLYTFGYKGSVTYPLSITVEDPTKDAHLSLKLETMVCKDICIPQALEASLDIPAGDNIASGDVPLIEFAKQKVPHEGNTKYLTLETAVASKDVFVVSMMSEDKLQESDLAGIDIFTEVMTEDGVIGLTAPPEIEINANDPRGVMFKIPKPYNVDDLSAYMEGKRVTITLVNGRKAIEKVLQF